MVWARAWHSSVTETKDNSQLLPLEGEYAFYLFEVWIRDSEKRTVNSGMTEGVAVTTESVTWDCHQFSPCQWQGGSLRLDRFNVDVVGGWSVDGQRLRHISGVLGRVSDTPYPAPDHRALNNLEWAANFRWSAAADSGQYQMSGVKAAPFPAQIASPFCPSSGHCGTSAVWC